MTVAPDFGHLDRCSTPLNANCGRRRHRCPGCSLADAGHRHQPQMERIVDRGIPVLIPPDAKSRKAPGPAGTEASMRPCAESSPATTAASCTANAKRSSSGLCQHQVQPRHRPLQTTRTSRCPSRMATDHDDAQPFSSSTDTPSRGRLRRLRRPQSRRRTKRTPSESALVDSTNQRITRQPPSKAIAGVAARRTIASASKEQRGERQRNYSARCAVSSQALL